MVVGNRHTQAVQVSSVGYPMLLFAGRKPWGCEQREFRSRPNRARSWIVSCAGVSKPKGTGSDWFTSKKVLPIQYVGREWVVHNSGTKKGPSWCCNGFDLGLGAWAYAAAPREGKGKNREK